MPKNTFRQRFSDFVDSADTAVWEDETGDEIAVHLCAAGDLLETSSGVGPVAEAEIPSFDLHRFWTLWVRYVLPN